MFDRMHKQKGWDELGYHFVIGNGTDSGNGRVEVGARWPKQKWGAHAKTPDNEYNDYGIGVCLVGNFDIERPTPQQMQSLAKLTAYLMKTYRIPSSRVLGHADTGRATQCPGRNLNIAQVKRMAAQVLADAGQSRTGSEAQPAGATDLTSDDPSAGLEP
jgi:N-acetyl-anhydromuramyl-L-alanine amidase AmpD